MPLFAVLKNNPRNLYFRKTTEHLCRRFRIARRVQAHVERRVVPEAESARGRIQLPRRNAQVGDNAARAFDLRTREDPRKFAKVGVHGAKALAEARQSRLCQSERFVVAIDTQHRGRVGRL